jgi:GR25 family glycosyltransferase involved in LPS biosynthesis
MRIYAVNCDKGRADRLLNSAAPLGLDIEIVPSPLATDEEVTRRGKACFERDSAYPTGLAATIGHMRAMSRLVESGESLAMIVEDDVRFHKDFLRRIATLTDYMMSNAADVDILTTGYVNFPYGTEDDGMIKNVGLGNPWGAQGYIITRQYAAKFLATFAGDDLSGPYSYKFVTDCVIFDPVLGCRRHTLVEPLVVEDPDEATLAGNNNKPNLFVRLVKADYSF